MDPDRLTGRAGAQIVLGGHIDTTYTDFLKKDVLGFLKGQDPPIVGDPIAMPQPGGQCIIRPPRRCRWT